MFGPSVGVLVGAFLIDRIERRTALALAAGAMALSALAFAVSDAPPQLVVLGIAFNLIGAIYIAGLSVYRCRAVPDRDARLGQLDDVGGEPRRLRDRAARAAAAAEDPPARSRCSA